MTAAEFRAKVAKAITEPPQLLMEYRYVTDHPRPVDGESEVIWAIRKQLAEEPSLFLERFAGMEREWCKLEKAAQARVHAQEEKMRRRFQVRDAKRARKKEMAPVQAVVPPSEPAKPDLGSEKCKELLIDFLEKHGVKLA